MMFEISNKSAATRLGFRFDIVIPQLELTSVDVEDSSKIRINIIFNKNNIKITSSRINVNEFKPERSFEFIEQPTILKDKLLKNPLECHVSYSDELIGTSIFPWPPSFVNCIAEGCGRELTQCDEAAVEKEGQIVGRMEIIARLQIKCREFEEPQVLQPIVNAINENDVLLTLSDTKIASNNWSNIDVLSHAERATAGHATLLDLTDLRNVDGKTVRSAEILNFIASKCYKAADSSSSYQEMINHLNKRSYDPPNFSKNNLMPHQHKLLHQLEKQSTRPRISKSIFSSTSSTDSSHSFYCISSENASEDLKISLKDDLKESPTKRYCPLCHDNITWLPKFAACPKCGFRSYMYDIEEKPYDHTLTANEIIRAHTDGNATPDVAGQSYCTCKNDKICAHCRVKKLCEDIFHLNGTDEECGKCESKYSDLYNICKSSSITRRPYLTKVFEELKHLYNAHSAKKANILSGNASNNITKQLNQMQNAKTKKKQCQKFSRQLKKNLEKQYMQFSKSAENHRAFKYKRSNCNKEGKNIANTAAHKTCPATRKIVPHNMGWLWNAEANGLRSGWVPGAIRKPIKVLMKHFLNTYSQNPNCDSKLHKGSHISHNEAEDYTTEPTLHISKKNGLYCITLRPLKAIDPIGDYASPHLHTKPIKFVIAKPFSLIASRKIKQHLKQMGFPKCICHRPISKCCCRSLPERKKLECQCRQECHKMAVPDCADKLILSDTTDSEQEFEFGVTPPAGAIQTNTGVMKSAKVSSATQYEKNDWIIEQKYPKPAEKYLKLRNRAIGNKFGNAFGHCCI